MPQPSITGVPATCTFGGLALPNGQGVMASVNLNDGTSWSVQDIRVIPQRMIGYESQAYRAKGVYKSDDFSSLTILLSMVYSEVSSPIGTALAKLSQGGEQYMSFDGSTQILAKLRAVNGRRAISVKSPYAWALELDFMCRVPWFTDISATSPAATTLVNGPSTPPSGRAIAGGALAVGTYQLAYTYVTASGETAVSPSTPSGVSRIMRGTPRFTSVTSRSRAGGIAGATAVNRSSGSVAVLGRPYSRAMPGDSTINLTTGLQQISVDAVTLPSFATGVKWYFMAGPTVGFTVQNANGNAFTLNTVGNNAFPPSAPATTIALTYAGSVFAEPVWTLSIPSSNSSAISSFTLTNTMPTPTEALTVYFGGNLAQATAYTFTIDCGAFTVKDANGTQYDYSGSFPMLYGPVGTVNTHTAQVVAATGTPTGVTVSVSYTNRWEL